MGTRGPQPKSSSTRTVSGSRNSSSDKLKPRFGGVPKCPTWLCQSAKKMFRALVRDMQEADVLAGIDASPLARYCQYTISWIENQKYLQDNGTRMQAFTQAGLPAGTKTRPEVETSLKIARELGKLEDKFGLSPAARERLTIADPETETSKLSIFIGEKDETA